LATRAIRTANEGEHPFGAEKSALEHLSGERKTISRDMGFFAAGDVEITSENLRVYVGVVL